MTEAPAPTPQQALASARVSLAFIFPSKTNPRTSFPAEDKAEMAASIRKHGGVFQALQLRPHPTKPGAYEIVDGERRYHGAKEVGLVDVPASVEDLTDDQVIERQIVSFLSRKDLTAMEEANCYNGMLMKKYTHERIAEKVGKSAQYVRDCCRLLKLVKGAQELLAQGRIEKGHAVLLSRQKPEDQIRIIRAPEEGSYDERHSGLWERQRYLPKTSAQLHHEDTDDDALPEEVTESALKPVSVRELAAWIDKHVKLSPEASETAELFPDVAAVVKAAEQKTPGEKPLKVIHITFDHVLADDVKKVDGPRVYGPRSWVRADGKAGSKECASSVAGIVIAGDARGEAFRVCIAKKTCQVHYKAEISAAKKREEDVDQSGKTGADRAALEKSAREKQLAKQEEQKAQLLRAIPAIQMALAEKVKTAPLGKLFAEISNALDWSAKQGLKAADKLLPAGKTPESWVRNLALAVITGPTTYQPEYNTADIANACKKYGLDATKICASANENDVATKAARKKPAKAKSAAKKAGRK